MAVGTLAHLAACKCVLQGDALKIARERIRVVMGYLGCLDDVWPLGKRISREIRFIARELLSLEGAADYSGFSTTIDFPLDMTLGQNNFPEFLLMDDTSFMSGQL